MHRCCEQYKVNTRVCQNLVYAKDQVSSNDTTAHFISLSVVLQSISRPPASITLIITTEPGLSLQHPPVVILPQTLHFSAVVAVSTCALCLSSVCTITVFFDFEMCWALCCRHVRWVPGSEENVKALSTKKKKTSEGTNSSTDSVRLNFDFSNFLRYLTSSHRILKQH